MKKIACFDSMLALCGSLSLVGSLLGFLVGSLVGCSDDSSGADGPIATVDGAVDAAVATPDAKPPSDAPPYPSITLGLAPVATGLSQPTVIVTPPGEARHFVAERTGTVSIVGSGGTKLATPFIDVSDVVSLGDEQGLVGLVFHPGYATNGRVFVYFTGADPDVTDDSLNNLHIWEYHRSDSDHNAVDPGHKVLLAVDHHQFPEHNGGNMRFGADGFLYVGIGDGGNSYDTVGSSRILTTRLSKILRLDVDHGDPYQPAPGNPFASMADPAAKEIWMWGLRNPWRWSFDRQTGDLWIGDVGQNCFEEIDHALPGQSGLDFGWVTVEGMGHKPDPHCVDMPAVQPGATLPVIEYDHGQGAAVVGGYVYRGSAIPELQGMYFFSDYGKGFLHSFWAYAPVPKFTGTKDWTAEVRQDDPDFVSISTFGEDPDGELLACSIIKGKCWRIVKK